MHHQAISGAVIFAKDFERVARFYEGLLTLNVVHAERDHLVLESEAMQLVIHAVPPRIAESIVIASPPERRMDTAIKLFFTVPSIAAARLSAAALGGELNPPDKVWEARGFRACDGHDPEGNVIQVREKAVSKP